MAIVNSQVGVTPGAGADVDTVTINGKRRQVAAIGSPDEAGEDSIAAVTNTTPGASDMGLVVRALIAALPALAAGTNNIGDVDVLTLPALPAGTNNIGDVDIASIAAGDNVIGRVKISDGTDLALVDGSGNLMVNLGVRLDAANDAVVAKLATDKLQNGLTAVTPVFAAIDVASSGDNTLLAAQGSGNKIRVHQMFLVASAAVTVRVESGAGGTALTGQMQLAANGGFVLPFSPVGWFETAANTLLNLELSGAVSVDGAFTYTVVT